MTEVYTCRLERRGTGRADRGHSVMVSVSRGRVAGSGERVRACGLEEDEPSSRKGGVGSVPAITLAVGKKSPWSQTTLPSQTV